MEDLIDHVSSNVQALYAQISPIKLKTARLDAQWIQNT